MPLDAPIEHDQSKPAVMPGNPGNQASAIDAPGRRHRGNLALPGAPSLRIARSGSHCLSRRGVLM
jgi:hypothetical protein